jgi:hypothetical protein
LFIYFGQSGGFCITCSAAAYAKKRIVIEMIKRITTSLLDSREESRTSKEGRSTRSSKPSTPWFSFSREVLML